MSVLEIRKSLKQLDPQTILLFIKLLEEYNEEWKEEIINVAKDEFLSLQGAIKRVRMIIIDLKRPVVEKKVVSGYTD